MANSKRYSRQIVLPEIGEIGQQKLQDARVLVIGAGGLGCPVLQNLAAAGVGNIGIVDGDVVEETNLHRQLLYTLKDCGNSKAETAKKAIFELNPEINVTVFSEFFTAQNAARIVKDYQIIVDCTDAITVRYLINDISVAKRIPMVYASIHKFEGQISVFNYNNGPSYRCLFPEQERLNAIPNCADSGVLGILPNTIGTLQATEVLKIILGIGEILSGKLLIYDALHFQTQTINFSKNPKMIETATKKYYSQKKEQAVPDIQNLNVFSEEKGIINGTLFLNNKKVETDLSPESFLEKCKQFGIVVIDVRELDETPEFKGNNVIRIPLSMLEDYSKKLSKNQEIVLFCQTGQRSLAAMNYLQKSGFVGVFHLGKGIESLRNQIE
ncbi:HesA/MoeB/ThiF family protein [Flavobacterium taihuense]|uniref:HesA/MoeB/ThiF family protein n=1 Tax=Flavobacterium taihuense TaxID=2857508 RepID=A0ABS6XT53_9FLAO|nr:HesA/MoeB/ThiF family protein [Flavobacterium taihuense]MBW4359845.1 HesA/MoeB/ThiF family protein [Flavobacterium taihuense]